MTVDDIFARIVENTKEVVYELEDHSFKFDDSLKALGANSIDRSEIVMMTLEDLNLSVPLVEFAKVGSMGELAQAIHGKL